VAAKLQRQRTRLDGIVVHNEAAVPALLEALQASGRRIPEDLAVVALCPDEVAEQAAPPLTSIAIPAGEAGREAVGLLMAKLNGQDVPDATLLEPRLTVRASTHLPDC
jgi:DNA-binding LacI/PurR family transcriptional regulator